MQSYLSSGEFSCSGTWSWQPWYVRSSVFSSVHLKNKDEHKPKCFNEEGYDSLSIKLLTEGVFLISIQTKCLSVWTFSKSGQFLVQFGSTKWSPPWFVQFTVNLVFSLNLKYTWVLTKSALEPEFGKTWQAKHHHGGLGGFWTTYIFLHRPWNAGLMIKCRAQIKLTPPLHLFFKKRLKMCINRVRYEEWYDNQPRLETIPPLLHGSLIQTRLLSCTWKLPWSRLNSNDWNERHQHAKSHNGKSRTNAITPHLALLFTTSHLIWLLIL